MDIGYGYHKDINMDINMDIDMDIDMDWVTLVYTNE